jgi:hypothetical protein
MIYNALLHSDGMISSGSSQLTGEEYEVEAIRGRRVHEGSLEYLIKWKGWPEKSNEWLSRVGASRQLVHFKIYISLFTVHCNLALLMEFLSTRITSLVVKR